MKHDNLTPDQYKLIVGLLMSHARDDAQRENMLAEFRLIFWQSHQRMKEGKEIKPVIEFETDADSLGDRFIDEWDEAPLPDGNYRVQVWEVV